MGKMIIILKMILLVRRITWPCLFSIRLHVTPYLCVLNYASLYSCLVYFSILILS